MGGYHRCVFSPWTLSVTAPSQTELLFSTQPRDYTSFMAATRQARVARSQVLRTFSLVSRLRLATHFSMKERQCAWVLRFRTASFPLLHSSDAREIRTFSSLDRKST